jgi:predicted nucleic acid-binding protein
VAERFGVSVYDGMIVAAGADIPWTEDLQHGALLEGVRITNPFLPAQS